MAKRKRTPAEIKAAKAERRKLREQAEREARKALEEQLVNDREGNRRPTPERVARGAFAVYDTEAAGVRFAVDTASTQLDRLRIAGTITPEQCQGGLDFAALIDRTRLIGQGRSCINFDPVGHDANDLDDPQAAHDERERRELYLACGTFTWAEMRRVCCEDRKPVDLDRLRAGLDLCVKFWT